MKDMINYWKYVRESNLNIIKTNQITLSSIEAAINLHENSGKEVKIMLGPKEEYIKLKDSVKKGIQQAKSAVELADVQISFYYNLFKLKKNN